MSKVWEFLHEPPAEGQKRRLGRYVLDRVVGQGGMGQVWRAWDADLGRWVALKMLRLASPEARTRFDREARVLAQLAHPNIVRLYDVAELDGRSCLAMEFVDGASPGGKALPVRRAVEIAADVASALAHAHANGLVHRDVKPGNVLVARDGRVLLGDFGLASDESQTRLTASGAAIGTPSYMAPEQVSAGDVGPRTDVYGLGATLYELLTGRPPFTAATVPQVYHAILNLEPTRPSFFRPDLPRDVETICLKAMEKDAALRYASASAMADDLRRFLAGEPIAAVPVPAWRRAGRWMRRRPIAVAVVLALTLGVATVLAVGAFNRARAFDRAVADGRRACDAGRYFDALRHFDAAIAVRRDDAAVRERERAARGLFEESLRAGDFTVARRMAADLPESSALLRRLEETRDAEPRRRRARLDEILAHLRRGLARDGGSTRIDDLVTEAAGFRDEQTVTILAEALAPVPARPSQEERDVAVFACRVLGHLGLDSCVAPLARFMAGVHDDGLAMECGRALCLTGRVEARVALYAARERLGEESFAWRRIEELLPRLPPPPDTEPATADDFFRRGIDRRELRDLAGADADLTEAIARDGALATAYLARAEVRRTLGRLHDALADLDRAIEIAPDYFGAFNNRGFIKDQLGRYDDAVADFDRSIALADRAPARVNRAASNASRGRSRECREDLARAHELEGGNPRLRLNAADALKRLGDAKGAIAELTRAVEIDPAYAQAYTNRGLLRADLREFDGAFADFARAIDLQPRNAMHYVARGMTRRKRRDLDRALEDLDRAVDIEPRNSAPYAVRGNVHVDRRNPEAALRDFSRAIELNPYDAVAWANRAGTRQDRGDLEGAVADYTRALELRPSIWQAWFGRGDARMALRRWDEAIADFTEGLRLQPSYPKLHEHRGFTRCAAGDHRGAQADLATFIELAPDGPHAERARKHLEECRKH